MRVPLFLVIAQWALLLGLGLLVITAYRQLGRVLGQSRPAAGIGPEVGSRPGRISYQALSGEALSGEPLSGESGAERTFVPGGRPAMLAFVDPTCPSCEELVTALGQASDAGELGDTRVLLLTADPPSYVQISAAFRATRLELGRLLDRDELEPYRATATPLLVAMDDAGVVRAAGTAARLAEVRAFRQASLLAPPALAPPAEVVLPIAT